MKFKIIILLLGYTGYLFGQENIIHKDSVNKQVENLFIENYGNQLNIKIDLSNDIENYNINYEGKKAILAPNLNIRYAIDFNYKFASVSIGVRAPNSKDETNKKGDSYIFRLKAKLLFNKWFHQYEYKYIRGYYIKNSNNFFEDEIQNFIQFPRLRTYVFSGSTAYKFNDKFSLKAISSQTEIQIKSAGSFIPSIDYWFYKINGANKVIDPSGELIERDTYDSYKGFATLVNLGYYYTFVYKKTWYINAYAGPGIGIDFYQINTQTPDSNFNRNYNSFITSLQSGIAMGYSSKIYYFGAAYNNKITSQNEYKVDFQFNTSRNIFHLFIGYRFKAPKPVKGTIEYIEKKVPLLEKEKN
ncbi:MAG: DUF4421 domain-containing protein [Flavobacteriaceae bacterium]|nr:DUF4421 domain-containing protein [Flavobacteriaceae bacterium]